VDSRLLLIISFSFFELAHSSSYCMVLYNEYEYVLTCIHQVVLSRPNELDVQREVCTHVVG
jgi:hypothetical protein